MILDEIVKKRKEQLAIEKEEYPDIVKTAEKMTQPAKDFYQSLKKDSGKVPNVIGEVKKASPSKGIISHDFTPLAFAKEYEEAGAAAVSVLTERAYFMGSNAYLEEIAQNISIPVLRKDFLVDPFQIYHSRVLEADAILLIAALLNQQTLREYIEIAESLSLHALVEVHTAQEARIAQKSHAKIIGINNRNLQNFHVDFNVTKDIAQMLHEDVVKISESGIKNNTQMQMAKEYGVHAVLVGETFMASGLIKEEMALLRGQSHEN